MEEYNNKIKILKKEVLYLYNFIFNKNPTTKVINEYINAHLSLFKDNPITIQKIELIEKKKLDIESIEYYLRLTNKSNMLSIKFHILLYIAETKATNFYLFYNYKSNRFSFILKSPFKIIRSIFKFLKGKYLNWRFKIV